MKKRFIYKMYANGKFNHYCYSYDEARLTLIDMKNLGVKKSYIKKRNRK